MLKITPTTPHLPHNKNPLHILTHPPQRQPLPHLNPNIKVNQPKSIHLQIVAALPNKK